MSVKTVYWGRGLGAPNSLIWKISRIRITLALFAQANLWSCPSWAHERARHITLGTRWRSTSFCGSCPTPSGGVCSALWKRQGGEVCNELDKEDPTWGLCTCWQASCRCWRPPWWAWEGGSAPAPSATSWTLPPSTSGSPPSFSIRFDLHKHYEV